VTLHTTYFGGVNTHYEPADADLVLGVVRYQPFGTGAWLRFDGLFMTD